MGVGANRHAADEVRQLVAEQFQHSRTDQLRPARVERHLAAIEVEGRLLSGGEREVAELEGSFFDQTDEGLFVVHGFNSPGGG